MNEGAMKRGRGRGRGGRGRGRGRGRGSRKPKKIVEIVQSDEELEIKNIEETTPTLSKEEEILVPIIDPEADISQLEAPTFTTINRGPPEPMLRLDWTHKVNLIGEKVLNPMIHCCDKCLKPILIYGRMIPCKHVFCLACAKQEQKQCSRCFDKVLRVEQTGLGTVFMCTHGGSRYGSTGCKRTYLSQRDLQAHINHRHVAASVSPAQQPVEIVESERPVTIVRPKMVGDPRTPMPISTNVRQRPSQQPVMSGIRTNLITVPIQDTTPHIVHETPPPQTYYNQYTTAPAYNQTPIPPMHIPPPQQPQYYSAPTAYNTPQNYQTYPTPAVSATQQYSNPMPSQTRTTPQYDYNSQAQQWPTNQQYYR